MSTIPRTCSNSSTRRGTSSSHTAVPPGIYTAVQQQQQYSECKGALDYEDAPFFQLGTPQRGTSYLLRSGRLKTRMGYP